VANVHDAQALSAHATKALYRLWGIGTSTTHRRRGYCQVLGRADLLDELEDLPLRMFLHLVLNVQQSIEAVD